MRLRAIPGTTLYCSRASKRTIPWGTFSSSRTIEASTTAWKHAPGWPSTPASSRCSFPKEHAGSICRKAGGASFDAMRSRDRVLPTLMRSSKRRAWPPRNSIGAPTRGSGDSLPKNTAPSASPLLLPPLRKGAVGCQLCCLSSLLSFLHVRLPQVEVSPTLREHFVNIREVLLISACYHSWRALTVVVERPGLINEKMWIAEEQSQSQN